jgi:hypothetical protein
MQGLRTVCCQKAQTLPPEQVWARLFSQILRLWSLVRGPYISIQCSRYTIGVFSCKGHAVPVLACTARPSAILRRCSKRGQRLQIPLAADASR